MRPVLRPVLIGLGLVLGLSACSDNSTPTIATGEVGTQTVVEVVEAPSNAVAAASATVSASATGSVRSLRVRDGQRVAKGDVLVLIDSPSARQNLAQAQQAAAAAPTAVSLQQVPTGVSTDQASRSATRAFDRARSAARRIPDRQLRRQALQQIATAEAQFRAAQAQASATVASINQGISSLEQALASLTQAQQAQAQLALTAAQRTVAGLTIRAPIAGRVVIGAAAGGSGSAGLSGLADQLPDSLSGQAQSLLGGSGSAGGSTTGSLQAGSPVSAGDPLLTITDVSALTLQAEVDETDVLLVHKHVKADVEFDAVPGASYRAVVRNVDLSPTTSSRGGVSYVVRLDLFGGTMPDGTPAPNPRPGMSAVVSLRVATARKAVAVPVSAVFRDGESDAVWLDDNGVARKTLVTLGAQGQDYLQVTDGVQLGDVIVVRGADQVSEGQDLP